MVTCPFWKNAQCFSVLSPHSIILWIWNLIWFNFFSENMNFILQPNWKVFIGKIKYNQFSNLSTATFLISRWDKNGAEVKCHIVKTLTFFANCFIKPLFTYERGIFYMHSDTLSGYNSYAKEDRVGIKMFLTGNEGTHFSVIFLFYVQNIAIHPIISSRVISSLSYAK